MIRETIWKRDDISVESRRRIERFTASKGWCVSFVKRHGINSIALHGEAGGTDVEAAGKDMAELRERLRQFEADCIYNVDETGLFHKLLPRRMYILKYENKKTLRGTRQMTAKDRITAYVCANADGSQKLPMAIIGKTKNPRCFRLGRPPVPYFSNKTAWSNTVTFRQWLNYVFIPHVRKTTSENVALIVDNASSHSELKDIRGQVIVLPLPPNVTAVHQAMDMGIIAAWKKAYRREMLREIIRDIETRAERRKLNKNRAGGMNGLAEGYAPHMLDVAKLVQSSWETVSQMTIARCWVKSDCLPLAASTDVNARYGRITNLSRSKDVSDVIEMLRKLKVSLPDDDTLRAEIDEDVRHEDVERGFEVEDDIDVQEAFVSDFADVFEEPVIQSAHEPDKESEDEEVSAVIASPPALADLHTMFRPLQESAFLCNLPDASSLLQRAFRVFIDAIRMKNNYKQRQLLVSEMFNKRPEDETRQ